MQRLSCLEQSVRTTHRGPSVVLEEAVDVASPSVEIRSDRPAKRLRTTSSLDGPLPVPTSEVDTVPQTGNEARHHITKELSTNGLLSSHQKSVLNTAIHFVDQLSRTPTPAMLDRSTFNKSMHISTDMSQREIFNVILGSKSNRHMYHCTRLTIDTSRVKRIG